MEARVWEERGLRDAVLSGDETAWRTLYDRCFAGLYRYAYFRAGRHPQRAEEVTQECWLVAVRRIRSFDPERGDFASWLRGIADKVVLNQQRRWQRRDRTELSVPAASAEPSCNPGSRADAADHVAVALAALPDGYQEVLRAKYEEGLSVAEIAARGPRTPKAVESLLTRARTAFRKEYSQLEG